MKADKVYLVGFMGAGKTTTARALGKRLDWKVEDTDACIEREERRDIPTIFRQEGEPYFRSLERAVLIGLLPQLGAVVASGGGTFADPNNRELMLRDGSVVWLWINDQAIGAKVGLYTETRVEAGAGGSWGQAHNMQLMPGYVPTFAAGVELIGVFWSESGEKAVFNSVCGNV